MFLERVKNFFSKRGSITSQLTLFYSISTLVLITLASFRFYFSMTHVLYNADKQFLSDEIRIIHNLLKKKPNDTLALQQEVNDVPSSLHASVYHYFVRVVDDKQNIVAETPNMNLVLKETAFLKTGYRWWQSSEGNHYLLTQSLAQSKNKSWLIQVALDVSYQQEIINKYRVMVAIVIFSGIIFSIIFGYLISHRALRRIHDLTETTKNITAHALQQRIDPRFWPKELTELGVAYNQMLDRIESSFAKLLQFSDDLSHELRTPIHNLMGEAETALIYPTTVEKYRQVIGSILEESSRIYQIIENILFLARAENPEISLEKTLLSAYHEIDEVCQFYQALADEKNIRIHCQGNAMIPVHSVMFRRMIGNVLSNAIQYSTCDNDISIIIREVDNQQVEISITDHGIGIAPNHLPHLFQRFYRTDKARALSSGGTGLGLSIVKSIVDLHLGTVNIISILNKGSSVIIRLPR